MNRARHILAACVLLLTAGIAHGQQFDAAFGITTLTAPSGASATPNHAPVTMGGGFYPAFSADYVFANHFGIGSEVTWRASQNSYLGIQPFRPILYDFDGMYVHNLGKRAAVGLTAGIGGASVRFYQSSYTFSPISGFTNFTTSTHFMGHFGGGLRLYVWQHLFVGPEAHLYLIHNNEEFSSNRAARFGVSIGYTFQSEQY